MFRQRWTRLASVHWPYDPDVVVPHLPAGCRPDVHDGAAWVGLLPFAMRRVAILGTPPLPYLSSFLETNIRTYSVGPDGRRGVVFLTLEADRLLPVLAARASYRLPYAWARMRLSDVTTRSGDRLLTYASTRRWPQRGLAGEARSLLRLRVGDTIDEPSALEEFLTARWGLHSTWWGRRGVWAPVEHEPWPLQRASLLDVDPALVTAVDLPAPGGDPHVLFSEGVDVRIGRPQPVRRG